MLTDQRPKPEPTLAQKVENAGQKSGSKGWAQSNGWRVIVG
jgi:hypothetical protein